MVLSALSSLCGAASAQVLLDPEKKDDVSFVRLFLQQPRSSSGLFGAFSLYRAHTLYSSFSDQSYKATKYVFDLDYGTLKKQRVTATGDVATDEPDLATNVGKILFIHEQMRRHIDPVSIPEGKEFVVVRPHYESFSVSGGLQHTRRPDTKTVSGKEILTGETQLFAPLVEATYSYTSSLGNRVSNSQANHDFQLWNSYVAAVNATKSIRRNGDKEYDLVGQPGIQLAWTYGLAPKADKGDDFSFQWGLFAKAGYAYAFTAPKEGRAFIDSSLVYNLTTRAGVELRYFDGFFGNNFRDVKGATELTFLARF
jgi:hypothetical protein